MSDDQLIADLVRAGVSADLIGRVANALVNVRDNVRDTAVREHERDRKRNWRKTHNPSALQAPAKANDVAGSEAQNVPPIVRDNGESAPTFLPSFTEFQQGMTEEEGRKKSKKDRSEEARARGQRMVAGAVLTEEFQQAAIDLGADPARVPDMWAEFVDYWVGVPGHRGVKLDWIATWRNDVRRKLKLQNGAYNGQRQQSLGDLARELADEVRERERAAGFGGPLDHVRSG